MNRLARALATPLLVLAPMTALADCPEAPDITAAIDGLLGEVQAARTEAEARALSDRFWEQWATAPDSRAQELLDEGMTRRASFDFAGAIVAFDALVDYCPDYAEGYNQRAFANFLRADFEAAVPDLERAIALSPRHVAAISGLGLTLISMGRTEEGHDRIREALALNPWLQERFYLPDPPDPTKRAIEL